MSLKTKSTIKYASPIVREIDDFSQLEGLVGQYDKQQLAVISFLPSGFIGGGKMFWDASQLKSGHDGDFIISPTVPWTLTYADYQAGTGETDPAGAGCWVRVGRAVGAVYEPGIDAPTDASIQSGSNVNGEFVRWPDGTQIVFRSGLSIDSNVASGSIFNGPSTIITFPIEFSNNDYVPIVAVQSSVRWGYSGSYTNATMGVGVLSSISATNASVNVAVIGRWY